MRLSTLALPPLPEDTVDLPRHESEVVPPADVPALRYVNHLLAQPGVVRACLFDLQTLAIRAHSGGAEEAQAMARQGRQLLSCGGRAGEEMALGQSIAEINLTLLQHRVVLRGVAALPGCVMHAILDRKAPPLGALPPLAQLMGVAQPA